MILAAFHQDGTLTFVDKAKQKQISLPLSQLASVPFESSCTNGYVVSIEHVAQPFFEDSGVEGQEAVRLHRHPHTMQLYTLGFELKQDLARPDRILNDIDQRQLVQGEPLAIFLLPRVFGSNMFLLRSRDILPNGAHSAVFQLEETYSTKTGVAFPVIYPDMWDGGWDIGTTR